MSQKQLQKPSDSFYKLAQELAVDEQEKHQDTESKSQTWIRMGNELEVLGYDAGQISAMIIKAIEDKLWELEYKEEIPRDEFRYTPSGRFYRVMRKQNWTRPYGDKSALGQNENSSLNTEIPEVVKHLRTAYNNVADEIDEFVAKLNSEYSLFENLPEQEIKKIEESIFQMQSFTDILKGIRDEKMKIPINTIHVLLYCLATEASVSYGAEKFFELRLEKIRQTKKQMLTAKQATKFQKGETNLELPLFNPKDRDLAIFLKYYGVQCPNCDSFRVKEKPDGDKLKCFDCDHTFNGKTIAKCRYCQLPLYKEDLLHIVKTWTIGDEDHESGGKCPNCNTVNHLPEALINYAKS